MLFAGTSLAADQKIGIVNVQNVFSQMPEAATMQQDILAEFKDQAAEIQKLEGDIKYNIEKSKRDEAIMSDKEMEELGKTILEQRKQYETKGRALQQNMERRKMEEQQKIIGRIMTAVNEVAKTEGFDFILSNQSVAFSKPDADISAKVVEHVTKTK